MQAAEKTPGEANRERELLFLAEELRKMGSLSNPESPAILRKLLGHPLAAPECARGGATPFLRVTTIQTGSQGYELVFVPGNDETVVALGRSLRSFSVSFRVVFGRAAARFLPRVPVRGELAWI
jgi:hypothetical protein